MPSGLTKGFKLSQPPKYDGNNTALSLGVFLATTLYKWLENLVIALENRISLLQQQAGTTISITGKMILPFGATITGNNAQDDIYRVNSSANFTITRVACWYRLAAGGTTPTVRVGSAASGAGSGISISLGATKDRGSNTGSIPITAGNAIFVQYTDCNGLGIGEIYLDFA